MCRSDNHGGHYHGGKAAARALIACKKLRVLKCNDLTFGERGGLEVAHGLKNGCPLLEILDGMNNVRVLNHFCNDSFSFSVLRISTSFKNVFVLVRVVTYILVLVAGGWWLVAGGCDVGLAACSNLHATHAYFTARILRYCRSSLQR